jgi:hypothetical protein
MWEPRRLTTLWASTACYRDGFTFFSYSFNLAECSIKSQRSLEYLKNSLSSTEAGSSLSCPQQPTLVPVMGQMKAVYNFAAYFPKTHFSIMLPHKPKLSQWFVIRILVLRKSLRTTIWLWNPRIRDVLNISVINIAILKSLMICTCFHPQIGGGGAEKSTLSGPLGRANLNHCTL